MVYIFSKSNAVSKFAAHLKGLKSYEWNHAPSVERIMGITPNGNSVLIVNNEAPFEVVEYAQRRQIPLEHITT